MTATVTEARICLTEGCENPLPITANNFRKYCDEHFVGSKADGPGSKRGRGRPRKEQAPKVVFEINSKAPKDKREAQIKKVSMVPMLAGNVISLTGDEECAKIVQMYSKPWAGAIVDLAEYEPWLKKMLEGSEMTGRYAAWSGVVLLTMAMAMPILAHHDLLPSWVGSLVGGVFIASQQPAGESEPQEAAAV